MELVAAPARSEPVTTPDDIERAARPRYGEPIDDAEVEAVIAECDGDPREAIRELLKINQALRAVVSKGYMRSRVLSPSSKRGGVIDGWRTWLQK